MNGYPPPPTPTPPPPHTTPLPPPLERGRPDGRSCGNDFVCSLQCILYRFSKHPCNPPRPPRSHIFNMDGAGADGNATPRFAAYGATKRSLAQLGKSLSAELGMLVRGEGGGTREGREERGGEPGGRGERGEEGPVYARL